MTTFVTVNGPIPKAAGDVLAERKRQIEAEGWDAFHDDEHDDGELARAGAAYALYAARAYPEVAVLPRERRPACWPWDRTWWKPKDPRRDLVRAAALILAEIERLDRKTDPASLPPG